MLNLQQIYNGLETAEKVELDNQPALYVQANVNGQYVYDVFIKNDEDGVPLAYIDIDELFSVAEEDLTDIESLLAANYHITLDGTIVYYDYYLESISTVKQAITNLAKAARDTEEYLEKRDSTQQALADKRKHDIDTRARLDASFANLN